MGPLNTGNLRHLVSGAGNVSRWIDNAIFKGEKMDSYNGKPARLLSFAYSIDKLKEQGGLDIWIGADGTPLATKSRSTRTMGMFMVISFDAKEEEEAVYAVVGDRLVTTRREARSSGSGMGEKGDGKVVTTVQVQS